MSLVIPDLLKAKLEETIKSALKNAENSLVFPAIEKFVADTPNKYDDAALAAFEPQLKAMVDSFIDGIKL
jgi:hypothetical protein